jgi:hypothetical protein
MSSPNRKSNQAKADQTPSSATKTQEPKEPTGKRYKRFHKAVNDDPALRAHVKKLVHDHTTNVKGEAKRVEYRLTVTNRLHMIKINESSSFLNDLRVSIPAEWKDKVAECLDGQSKVTFTWAVSALNKDLNLDTIADDDECSHRCCEYDQETRKRLKGGRCVDGECLTWESKSDNQSRANALCRKKCHCGCGKYLCKIYRVHKGHCI